jgi:hypothetical protein
MMPSADGAIWCCKPSVYRLRAGHWVTDSMGGTAAHPTLGMQHRQAFESWDAAMSQALDIAADRHEQNQAALTYYLRQYEYALALHPLDLGEPEGERGGREGEHHAPPEHGAREPSAYREGQHY